MQQRGFAGAAGAHQGVKFAAVEDGVEFLQSLDFGLAAQITLGQMMTFNYRFAHGVGVSCCVRM